ncbi:MAG: HAD-IIIA family hydrolase [Verrucomicrobiota bacterium]
MSLSKPLPLPRRCLFFDRDGVINQSPGKGYVLSWKQFVFNPGIIDLLSWIKKQNILLVLVTSQRGVGKGLMSQADLDQIHDQMQSKLAQQSAKFDAIYSYTQSEDCFHLPKPDPEMLFSAAQDFNIDLYQSWMIGDSDRDITMGRAANLKGCIRFLSDKLPEVESDHSVKNAAQLQELLRSIL